MTRPVIDPEHPGRFARRTSFLRGGLLLAALGVGACKGDGDEPAPSKGEQERTLVTLQSYVYTSSDESSFATAGRIRDQIKSAFGGLRSLRVTASNKALENDLEEQIYKEPLILVAANGRETVVFRVWYRYSDEVFAPSWVQRGVPIMVGGLHRQEDARFTEIVNACTPNTAKEREYKGRLQVVFDGSLSGCQDAIVTEQSRIDAARVRLDAPEDEIVPEELERVYVPVVARLMGRKASQMGRYPRFEPVIPLAGRGGVASSPSGRTTPAVAGAEGADVAPAGAEEPPAGAATGAVVVPVAGAGAQRSSASDEETDPDAPPDPQAGVPIIAAGGAKGPGNSNPVQPRGGASERSFNWEDLGDPKYWVLWLAVFALYPLLKRRPTDG